MCSYRLLVWVFVTSAVVVTHAGVPESLRLVHYLFRHGDRSPIGTYSGDPNPPETWPKGFGQLTVVGMRQQYELGQYFRQRYDGFISKTYYNREVYIRSTDIDRTLMSAYTHLSGLYPPNNDDIWNNLILWQPIPVHTVPREEDLLLLKEGCPKHKLLHERAYGLPYFRNIIDQYSAFMNWISEQTGEKYDILNIGNIADAILIENLKKLPLPAFASNQSVIDNLAFLMMVNIKADVYSAELQRISGGAGPLVKDVIDRIRLKIAGKLSPDLKLYIYSAHDTTVSAFLQAINSFNDLWPPYTATVIMELHETTDRQYYLQFSYKNETTKEPYDIIIPGCSLQCPFEKFLQLTAEIIPENIQKECQLSSGFANIVKGDGNNIQTFIFASIAGVSVAIVLLELIVILRLKRRQRQYEQIS